MATFFSLKKTAATFCLLSFLSISAISCGVANRQILPGGPGIVPGGGSSSQGGGSASGSYIPPPPPTSSLTPTPTTLADAFSKTVEEIGSQQQTITFTASNSVDAVTGFSVVINAEKNPTDWSISGVKKSDSSPCAMPNEPVPLGANDQCKVTITFTPKSIASYDGTFNASLTYSYTNNKGIDPRNEITIPLLSNGKKFSPLLLRANPILSCFVNSTPVYGNSF